MKKSENIIQGKFETSKPILLKRDEREEEPSTESQPEAKNEEEEICQAKFETSEPLPVQRIEKEEAKIEPENLNEEDNLLQGSPKSTPTAANPQSNQSTIKSTIQRPDYGSPLSRNVRERVEPALGVDMSHVKVHSNYQAAESSEALNAKAFTHKNHIWLGRNQNPTDVKLMAHELTHVVQQGAIRDKVQQETIPYARDNEEAVQSSLIQRQAECKAKEEKRGSKEQAKQAETAPATGTCVKTNPPAEQPPEGTKKPEGEETPAEVEANEGAPVDERQSNAPPPDENAPQREQGIAKAAEQSKEAPQDPCSVREAAGVAIAAPGAGASEVGGQPVAAAAKKESNGGREAGEQSQTSIDQTSGEDAFLVESINGVSATLQPEGLGEAASPEIMIERDQLSGSANEALSALKETSIAASSITTGGLQFIVPSVLTGDPDTRQEARENHQRASSRANAFLSNAGRRLSAFITLGIEDSAKIRMDTEQKKATILVEIQKHRAGTKAIMEQLRASAQATAQSATQQVEARHLESLSSIEAQALEAQAQIDLLYESKEAQLEQVRVGQLSRLDEVYQTGYNSVIKIGSEKGKQAENRAREHENAYRRGDGAGDKQTKVQNREKDGFWDGYLTYNRYMARADAAKEVGEQYRDGFQEEARAQADNMMCGKSRDIEFTQLIADQGFQSLGCARDNAIDSVENQRLSAISLADQARQKSLNTIQNSLQATITQLNEREAGQFKLLQDYGIRQQMAIERDSERAFGSMLQGINDAAVKILQYLSQFREQVENSEAPNPDNFLAQLAAGEAQLSASLDGAKVAFAQTFVLTQSSLAAGQQQASGALEQLYQRGIDDAQQLADSFEQAMVDLVAGTMSGYDQIIAAFDERMTGGLENSTQILEGVITGTISVFEQINSGISGRFQECAVQMQQGMQNTLDNDLDQKICAEAEKAAADVQPWWKSVLKVLLIIVVIVVVALVLGPAIIGAVGAAATALAGSLGVGAALAGTIGAWVGPIIGGAIVGAIAGASIQLGTNALYNKPLGEGLKEAIIAGAIGGALGGLGGQLGQVLVGRFATTIFSRVAIQYGTDVAFDIVGGILGDLAAGNPITWQSVAMGLAIGGAVQLSMGGIGSLAKARATGAAAEGFIGSLARGRLGRYTEAITGLQKGSMAFGERLGARMGGFGPKAPTVKATSEALAGARARIEEGEFFPTRGGQEPEGWRGRPGVKEQGRTEIGVEAAPPPREFSDSTDINDPKVRQEIDDLGSMTPESRQILADNPRLRQALLENPAAARALKKCASPCFPTNMDLADVKRLSQFLESHPDLDASKLTDYLYEHRGSPSRLADAIDRLAASPDPKAFIDEVELPKRVTSAELDEAAALKLESGGMSKGVFDELSAMGYPSDVLEGALKNFKGVREEGDFANFVEFLRSFRTGNKPRALAQALENLHAGAGGADSDFLSRVSNMHQEPSLRPLDVDALRARYDDGDALLAQGHLQSGMTPDKTHEVTGGYILQTPSGANPSKQLSKEWGGTVDFVIVDKGGGLELVIGKEHSGLSNGAKAVYGAGEISFNKDGKITGMKNLSGHYLPSAGNLERAYKWLVNNRYLDSTIPVDRKYF